MEDLKDTKDRLELLSKEIEEEANLKKRLDVQNIFDRIFITEFGTVYENKNEEKEELFDEFIEKIEEEIKKEENAIKYDQESNKFFLIEKLHYYTRTEKIAREIDINKDIMEDYAFGKPNRITSKLHDLYLKSMTNEEKESMVEKRNEIIKQMNTTHDLPTPAEARIYLDYLEELERENNKVINDNRKGIILNTAIPTSAAIALGTVYMATGVEATAIGLLASAFNGAFISSGILNLYNITKIKDSSLTSFPIVGNIEFIQRCRKENKEIKESNKLINTKATKLLEIENVDRMIVSNSYSIEEFDSSVENIQLREALNLKDQIMKDIDNIVSRLDYVNAEDRSVLLKEAKSILNEYSRRYKDIANQDSDVIDLEADNLTSLRLDMYQRISDLEIKLSEVRNKDIKIKAVTDEERLLTEKIEGFSDIDEEIEKVRNISQSKVKVKSLQRN